MGLVMAAQEPVSVIEIDHFRDFKHNVEPSEKSDGNDQRGVIMADFQE